MDAGDNLVALLSTDYIDFQEQVVVTAVNKLTENCTSETEKALAIFHFVRDEVVFGWGAKYGMMKASETLEARVGYSLSKSTLFVAMLRAVEIPSRVCFTSIPSRIYAGLDYLDYSESEFCDHCYVEVLMHQRWIKLDSFVVDKPYFEHAMRKLVESNLLVGYGIRPMGSIDWDGEHDSFVQFDPSQDASTRSMNDLWGTFADVGEFYAKSGSALNKYDIYFPFSLIFSFQSMRINSFLQEIRSGNQM